MSTIALVTLRKRYNRQKVTANRGLHLSLDMRAVLFSHGRSILNSGHFNLDTCNTIEASRVSATNHRH
jgi:hypothetical protein